LVKFRGGHLPINTYGVAGETNVIGSVFVAELTSVDSATTTAYLFGKPTQNGLEPCTSFDPAGSGPCIYAPVYVTSQDEYTPVGTDEADTVRSVILDISPTEGSATASSATPASPSEPEPKPIWKCQPSQDPKWKDASPEEKKRMLEACLQP
jgi:hypothetical protein